MKGTSKKRTWVGADGKERTAYRVRYVDPNGQRRSKTFARKVDADRFLDEQTARVVRGEWVDPADGDVTFGDYFTEWCDRQVWRPGTASQVASHARNHVLPHLGHYRLRELRKSHLQGWVKLLSTTLAPATVEVVYRYVASSLKSATEDQRIMRTPCVGVTLPKRAPSRVEPLATEQVVALAEAIDDRYRALVLLAAGTGLRQGEAFGVTNVDRVRFMDRRVVVDRQIVLARVGRCSVHRRPRRACATCRCRR